MGIVEAKSLDALELATSQLKGFHSERIKELKASRDNWKKKYMLKRDHLLKAEKELSFIKKTVGRIIY